MLNFGGVSDTSFLPGCVILPVGAHSFCRGALGASGESGRPGGAFCSAKNSGESLGSAEILGLTYK